MGKKYYQPINKIEDESWFGKRTYMECIVMIAVGIILAISGYYAISDGTVVVGHRDHARTVSVDEAPFAAFLETALFVAGSAGLIVAGLYSLIKKLKQT